METSPRSRLFLEGAWHDTEGVQVLRSPYSGDTVGEVCQAQAVHVERALAFASTGRTRLAGLSAYARREVLRGVVRGLERRADELAGLIVREAGKPITLARAEVRRAISTFSLAEAAVAFFGGETPPIDLDPYTERYGCQTRRVPAGVVVGIVPFNFPLNLGAHKVAPALAVGAPIIIKPPPQAPGAQVVLAEIVQEAGADPAALQVLPCDDSTAERLATDERVRVLSFTGSGRVGAHLRARARGRVVLELGGNAAAVVAEDADLDWAVERVVSSAFGYAGQVCIKTQRLLVDRRVLDRCTSALVERTRRLTPGDPARDDTLVGPVIDDAAAARIEAWVREARARGADVLCGDRREGRLLWPTVLRDVPRDAKVYAEEVFGPVLCLRAFDTFDEAVALVNESAYGLQASVFTRALEQVQRAFLNVEVGALIINDAPSFRSDAYPYGGVKGSGLGREGVWAAMLELTEPRVLVTRRP